MDFHSLKSPLLDFIVIQTGYWPDSNLGSVFIIKIIFIMKNVTNFRKTVETSVDPCLSRVREKSLQGQGKVRGFTLSEGRFKSLKEREK